jgi:hypothetical protein
VKSPPDSVGSTGLIVVSLSVDGEVTALDSVAAQGPCPSWLLYGEMTVAAGRSLTLLAPTRDQDKPGVCSNLATVGGCGR